METPGKCPDCRTMWNDFQNICHELHEEIEKLEAENARLRGELADCDTAYQSLSSSLR